MSDFWEKLAKEELSHGELLRLLYERIREGELSFARKDFNLSDIIGSMHKINGVKELINRKGYSDLDALKSAVEFESDMIEHHFFMVFEGDSPEIKSDFDALRMHTETHLKRVLAKKAELES